MNNKSILFVLCVNSLVFGTSIGHTAELIPTDAELTTQCKQFAIEDQVTPKEMDAYVSQCVLDLKEQYLPGADNPANQPLMPEPPKTPPR